MVNWGGVVGYKFGGRKLPRSGFVHLTNLSSSKICENTRQKTNHWKHMITSHLHWYEQIVL